MPFPQFNSCAVCESIRPELGGKLTLLGFYGFSPTVEIVVGKMGQPLSVAIVAGFPPISPQEAQTLHRHYFIVADPNGKVLFQTPASPLNAQAGKAGVVAAAFIIPPTIAGKHTVKVLVDDEVKLEGGFTIRAATAGELQKLGLPPVN
jgi:hypothetical protein